MPVRGLSGSRSRVRGSWAMAATYFVLAVVPCAWLPEVLLTTGISKRSGRYPSSARSCCRRSVDEGPPTVNENVPPAFSRAPSTADTPWAPPGNVTETFV